jgi:hypothetical protein
MAILEKPSGWEVDQVLPRMLKELDVELSEPRLAAIHLTRVRIERIQRMGEDPLDSIGYFYKLLCVADYPSELSRLGWLGDCFEYADEAEIRNEAIQAMEEFLDPELAERRREGRFAAYDESRKLEWPFVFDSPSGRKLFQQRWKERMVELRPLFRFMLITCPLVGWALGTWKLALIGLGLVPFGVAAAAFGVYRKMKRECQNHRWRHGLD